MPRIVLLSAGLAMSLAAAPPGGLVEISGATYDAPDALTGVKITVTLRNYLMGSAEITQREFTDIMGYNPAFHKGPDLPVENVSWWEAVRYCNLRSIREQLEPAYNLDTGAVDPRRNGYRLPTEAEWTHAAGEPAARTPSANLGSDDTKSVGRLVRDLKITGTRPAGSYPANRYGLYDMIGNVWEWCGDYFNPVASPQAPVRGLARVIRGGSFISTTSRWSRRYRSSMDPSYKSRFTGFRVARSIPGEPVLPAVHRGAGWFAPYNQPPAGYESSIGDLTPLLPDGATRAQWEERRQAVRAKWMRLLGSMDIAPPPPAARLVETVADQNYTGRLMYLQVEPDWWEKIFIMMPANAPRRPVPVVIVPYYDVDVPAGRNLGGRTFMPASVRSFAYMAVQRGYMAVAIRWFGESYGESYSEAVANLKLRHPRCTGLGKWVWDAQRLLDYLYTLPQVDRRHIGIMGHSLGSKMAVYAAAFDARITTVVASEGGIGLSFSNYEDYWYFGDSIKRVEKGTDQHELLGLIAPRPFLLIGGDQYDTAKSWYYINAARPVYQLYGKPMQIGYFNHHKGHTPTPEAVWRSMEWLAHFLGPA